MKKVKVNKLECRFPSLFKVMWFAIVVWMVVAIANYFGRWLLPDKLDGFGMSVLFLFGVTMICCFRNGLLLLMSKHDMSVNDVSTRRVASYVFMVSFVVLLVISIWEICGTADSQSDFTRNGTVTSIPIETVFSIVGDLIKALFITIGIVLLYWYVRLCFVQFSGRIRRIGVEIALALMMMAYFDVCPNDMLWVNLTIILIAAAFLYDIWRFADFKDTQLGYTIIIVTIQENG